MNINEIRWHLGRVENEYEANVKKLETLVRISERGQERCTRALIACRDMLERGLPHIIGQEIEKDYRLYLNIISDVIGDFGKSNLPTLDEQRKWIFDQLMNRQD